MTALLCAKIAARCGATPSDGAPLRAAAPVVIIPCANNNAYLDRYARPENGHTDRSEAWWPTPYWDVDTGFAALLILLTAIDLGLGACFFGVPIDRIDVFRRAFDVPPQFRPIGAISVGYRAEPPTDISRHRRPEEEVLHRGRWSASPGAAGG